MDTQPAVLTVEELAQRWRVSVSTVKRLIHRGELRAMRIGRAFRIRLEEVERFERDNQ